MSDSENSKNTSNSKLEKISKKQKKRAKLAKMINDKTSSDLTISCRTLGAMTFKTLNNIHIDIKFFKTYSVDLVSRMYSYARLYEIEKSKEYLKEFRLKLEDLRSTYRFMFELSVIGQGSTFQMCEAFQKVDEEFSKLCKLRNITF